MCTGSVSIVCTASDQCHDAGTCDPSTGMCSNPAKPNGTTCNDGDACTQTDTCQAGVCTGSNDVICTASDQCHNAGTCDPSTGQCSNPNKPNGTTCNDGSACTTVDVCTAGVCTGSTPPNCNDNNGCTDDSCDPSSGCVHTNNTASCDDGSACTTNDTCSNGICMGGPPPNCDDSNGCTDDSCVCVPLLGRGVPVIGGAWFFVPEVTKFKVRSAMTG